MAKGACPDGEFIRLFTDYGPHETARKLGINARAVYRRRERMEAKLKRSIKSPSDPRSTRNHIQESPHRRHLEIEDGVVLVGGDAHFWPEDNSTSFRAFVKFAKDLKPKAVILNGDMMDCACISRHPPIGWDKIPTLVDEIETTQDRLHTLEQACGRGVRKIWTLGNHDGRFETKLATVAPEYRSVKGSSLTDHFPQWEPCWSTWINDDVVVKHRFKGGMHAARNNTLYAGKTILTNHLHSQKVAPFTDYNGTRHGVDTGCLADTNAPAFTDYTEDNPKDWRAGFCVLTFWKGRVLPPELVTVWDDSSVVFRGSVIKV